MWELLPPLAEMQWSLKIKHSKKTTKCTVKTPVIIGIKIMIKIRT